MTIVNFWPRKRSPHDQFEELLRPHLRRLYNLAYRFSRNPDDAEDLVQDILLKLYPRLKEMQSIEKLGPWLARVLYRHYIDKLRSEQRSPIEYMADEEAIYETHAADTLQPSELLDATFIQQHMQQALNQLNDDQRIAIILHDVEEYSLQEISEILSVPTGTLKSRLSRARDKLRTILRTMEPFSQQSRVKEVTR